MDKDNNKLMPRTIDRAMAMILILGAVTSSVIAIIVIAVPLLAPILSSKAYKIPEVVSEWGGIIIGFYFGSFVTFAATIWKGPSGEE